MTNSAKQAAGASKVDAYAEGAEGQDGDGATDHHEILDAPEFYFTPKTITSSILAKNPEGYCGLGGIGVSRARSVRGESGAGRQRLISRHSGTSGEPKGAPDGPGIHTPAPAMDSTRLLLPAP